MYPVMCIGNLQICQSITREGQATEYVTIARDTVPANWMVYSVSPLKFEVLYSGGDSYSTTERERCVHVQSVHVDFTQRTSSCTEVVVQKKTILKQKQTIKKKMFTERKTI